MLKIVKNNNLNGTIEIDETIVVQLNANITIDESNGGYNSSGVSRNVLNMDLYRANINQIRTDINAFEDEVLKVEDELLAIVSLT